MTREDLRTQRARLEELMNRLRVIESPADVELPSGRMVPALPLADARFFAARRIHAVEELVQVLALMEEGEDLAKAKRVLRSLREAWADLTGVHR